MPQRDGDDDRVVEVAGDGDEVGDEVDRHREVEDQRAEHELAAARDARVGKQATEEHEAVGDEPRERTRSLPAASERETGHEERVWLDQLWAEYLTLTVTSLLIPFELYELAIGPSLWKAAGLLVNVLIVIYLAAALGRRLVAGKR